MSAPRRSGSIGPSNRLVPLLLAGALLAGPISGGRAAEPMTAQDTLRELRGFRELGSVLYVAAHPDDENTQLIAYLARGRGYRTAYLSLTRGDGGQNVIGPELFEELGVIRTQELLAARRLDGGRQFFTRADRLRLLEEPAETLRIWDRKAVVSDIVRVIRTFRPDVIITRFSPQGGGHGHHTASAILAVEAFKLAGDPKAFPDQIGELAAWQPKRILQNGGGFGRAAAAAAAGSLRIEIGGNDPVTGEPLGTIAGRSRSMHKSQGFGNFGGRGGRRPAHRLVHAPGRRAGDQGHHGRRRHDLGPRSRRAEVAQAGRRGDREVRREGPRRQRSRACWRSASGSARSPADPVVTEKRRQLDRAIQGCLGLVVETTVPRAEVVPGEVLRPAAHGDGRGERPRPLAVGVLPAHRPVGRPSRST